ncbi:hypothetical protein F4859DRAFT_520023 [Xylaria cf. heliscus]|nr:hypothetical protein F4859DRAFT_520023 [Xylaria cf. heliscus]
MFTTFSAQMSPVPPSASITPPNGASGKRRKVARACDSCRLNRVRCDDNRPCENCRSRGEKCKNALPWEAHSLPAAKREIERLQDRLNQLQKQQSAGTVNVSPPTPPDVNSVSNGNAKSIGSQLRNNESMPVANEADQATRGQGSPWESYSSSPSSTTIPVLIQRMGCHTESDSPNLEQGNLASDRPNGSHMTFTRSKERQFLNLFWKGYPWLHPILDREEIYRHHDSLWNDVPPGEQQKRLPSALIDILLALSMQYGSTFLLRDSPDSKLWGASSKNGNASLAGQSFCQRSHRLHLENPRESTLDLVQWRILSSVYFLNAASLNRASTALASAVRMAQILRLHETTPSTGLVPQQERLRSNTWRLLIALDGHYAILLGLPPLVQPIAEENLVIDFWQCTVLDETNSDHDQSRSWETFHIHHTKLILAAHLVHSYFLRKKGELLRQGSGSDFQSPFVLESFAESMTQKLGIMRRWVETVPPALTIPRPGGGGPFSAVWGSILDLDPQAPLHFQQQRLSLELGYHHLSLLLIRSFVQFMQRHHHPPQMRQVDAHFVDGLKHAISIVNIMYQALANGDILTGWLLFFGCQWDATLYLLKYITAFPIGPFAADTRKSLSTSIETLKLMGKYLGMAKTAHKIVQCVLGREPTSPNDLRALTSMISTTTVPTPMSSLMDESRNDYWNDYRYLSAFSKDFSQGGNMADAIQPPSVEPLDPLRTLPSATSFTDPFVIDSDVCQNLLAHQNLDDMVEMYPILGDWHLVPFDI